MHNLGKLLGQKKAPTKAPELIKIELWCKEQYPQFKVGVQKRTRDIIIRVPHGPLAQEIQMRLLELKEFAGLPVDARLTIRIS